MFGDAGLLGQALIRKLPAAGYDGLIGVSVSAFEPRKHPDGFQHHSIDVAREDAWIEMLAGSGAALVVNAIAITDVAACEKEPALARRLHVDFPARLASECGKMGAKLVQVSTDQVFDGNGRSPYRETDTPNPVTVYGRTKLDGERAALDAVEGALVLRTNIVGVRARGKPTFGEWLCGSFVRGEPIRLAEDFVTSSMFAGDFAERLVEAAEQGLEGLYHVASSEPASKYTFGGLVARELGVDFSRVECVKLRELKLSPPRPAYLALDVRRFERATGRPLSGASASARMLAAEFKKRTETA